MKRLILAGFLLLIPTFVHAASIEAEMIPAPTELQNPVPRLFAQVTGSHTVSLSWILSTDDTTTGCATPNTCLQTTYRAPGACSTSSVFASIGSPAASSATFIDTSVVPGVYCYAVSFTQNALESGKDTLTVTLPPASPTGLAGSHT